MAGFPIFTSEETGEKPLAINPEHVARIEETGPQQTVITFQDGRGIPVNLGLDRVISRLITGN